MKKCQDQGERTLNACFYRIHERAKECVFTQILNPFTAKLDIIYTLYKPYPMAQCVNA